MAARMSAQERRALLIDAAITVMARDGVPHTTTRSIVAEAGMQIGVFHYCFRSKEELVLEVMKTIGERNFAMVGSILDETSDPTEIIQATIGAYWAHVENNPETHLLTYELTQYALRQPGHEAAATAQYDTYVAGMQRLLSSAAEVGGFDWSTPLDVLARVVLAYVEGLTFQWLVTRDGERARVMLEHLAGKLYREAGIPEPSSSEAHVRDRITARD